MRLSASLLLVAFCFHVFGSLAMPRDVEEQLIAALNTFAENSIQAVTNALNQGYEERETPNMSRRFLSSRRMSYGGMGTRLIRSAVMTLVDKLLMTPFAVLVPILRTIVDWVIDALAKYIPGM